MFIRKKFKKDKKTNKQYWVYQLIESIRTKEGPRQRILLHLGSDLNLQDQEIKELTNRIKELISGTLTFIKCPEHIEELAQIFSKQLIKRESKKNITIENNNEDYQIMDANSIEHKHSRTIGMEYIAYEILKKLKLDSLFYNLGFSKRQIETCIGVIIGKLAKPDSERTTYHWMKNLSAIDELLDTNFNKLSLNSIYKVADLLLRHKPQIEDHLTIRENDLFSLDNTVVLFDLTNTFFEGRAEDISLAKRGHSKENRSDCPLVTLGLVLNQYGFPIKTRVLPGNISEPSTLKESIEKLNFEESQKPIIVIDAGIATEDNIKYLRKECFRYIVSSRTRSCKLPEDVELNVVKKTKKNIVKAKKISEDKNGEIKLICHSQACEQKELSIKSLLHKRFEEDLIIAKEALTKKRGMKLFNKVSQRIGRLKEKHKKISSYYKIDIKTDEKKEYVIDITWQQLEEKIKDRFQGAYLLRVYGLDWSEEKLWNTYIMLTQVEEGFRCLKSDLGLRPIFHKIDRRVEGHLFLSVIAYHIMQTILYQLQLFNINISFKTLRDNMNSLTRVTTSIQLKDSRNLHVRSSTLPEAFHKKIFQALQLSQNFQKKEKVFI